MASESPNCPDCSGPIGADWDWCMHCGYDPDHLKPWDWRPTTHQASMGSVQTATAPGQVGLIDLTERKGRTKRADKHKPKRKARGRKNTHTEPPEATMASTHSLISLPARPKPPSAAPLPPVARDGSPAAPAPTPPTPNGPTPPLARTAPEAREVVPSAPAYAPAAQPAPRRPSAPADPIEALRPGAAPEQGFSMAPVLGTQAYAPTPYQSTTRTIALPRTLMSLVPVVVLFALAALMLFVAVSSMAKLGEGSILSRATTVLFVLVCLALACGMAAQAYTFLQVRVEVSSTEIVAHNRFGRPSKAKIRDIFSVTLGSRRYLDVPLLGRAAETPYVQMQDGSGFWLDALEGRAGEPPTPEQLAVVDALARSVAANRSEALQDDGTR